MTFSFDTALGTDRDLVRSFIGDTSTPGHMVENETIAAVLVRQPNPVRAAAVVCRMIAATYARKADKQIGKTKIDQKAIMQSFLDLAETYEAQGSVEGGGAVTDPMHVGGISEAKREDLVYGDTDRIQPAFALTKDDIQPGTVPRDEEP